MNSVLLELGRGGGGGINKNVVYFARSPDKLKTYHSNKGPLKCLLSVFIFNAILIQIYAAVMNMNIFWNIYIYNLVDVIKWIL